LLLDEVYSSNQALKSKGHGLMKFTEVNPSKEKLKSQGSGPMKFTEKDLT